MPLETGDVLIPTLGVYPSGGVISVYATVGKSHAQITDAGGAMDELSRLGKNNPNAIALLKTFAKKNHLFADNRGWLSSQEFPVEHLGAYIAIVASASREAVRFIASAKRPKRQHSFREIVDNQLSSLFNEQLKRHVTILGSVRKHKFDYGLHLSDGRQLLLDLVVPDANSINSAVVAHLDVKRSGREEYVQRIVFDSEEEWKSGDIALLSIGATAMDYRALPTYLKSLAA